MCKKFAIFSPPGMSFMSSLVMERSAIVDTRYTITATAMATSMHSAMRDHDTAPTAARAQAAYRPGRRAHEDACGKGTGKDAEELRAVIESDDVLKM